MEVLSQHTSVYDAITRKIAEAIKRGTGPYRMPWHTSRHAMSLPVNVITEAYYRGVNVLSLWLDAQAKSYPDPYWASYRQWQKIGAQVRKGERGSLIVFYKRNDLSQEDADDDRPQFVLRTSYVFNVAQVDGWVPPLPGTPPWIELDKQVAAFVGATGAHVDHGYQAARYRIDLDRIEMPSSSWFFDTETSSASQSYHAVLLHELVHWTGANHRIGREFGKRFGDETYAFEELIAELGAAFLCAGLKIVNEPRADHAAYVASWLKILDNDTKAIFTAAKQAQEAVTFLANLAAERL